jgi:hypothetical protein
MRDTQQRTLLLIAVAVGRNLSANAKQALLLYLPLCAVQMEKLSPQFQLVGLLNV